MAQAQTIIPRDPSLVAVAKDGKFLGYADAKQIADFGLERYVEPAAPGSDEPVAKAEPTSEGADPAAIRKGPAKPKTDA
jgi:hypothetical protein